MLTTWRTVVAIAAITGTLGQPAPLQAQPAPVVIDAIVATVNGQVITDSDVRAAAHLAAARGPAPGDPVAQLIDRALMLDEVQRASQAVPPAEQVEARRHQIEAALGPTLMATLATRDALTDGRLTAWLRDDLRIEAYIAQRFTAAAQPTDEEVASFFVANAARFAQPGVDADDAATARARAALVEVRRRALIEAWLDGLRRRADIVATPR